MKALFAIAMAGMVSASPASWSQSAMTSPIALWQTVDDKSGEVRGAVRLFESNGAIYGRIEQVLDPRAVGQVCDKCSGDRHDKPVLGLDIIRGVRPDGPLSWSGGEILDPESGETYRVSLRLEDNGRKLVVRGSILGGMIGRSQTWIRASP